MTKEHIWPDTRAALTPSGARHVFVAGDLKTGRSTLGPDIDTHGSDGYVVAPGSHVVANGDDVSVTGFYRWENDRPVASVPWINECAKARTNEQTKFNTETMSKYSDLKVERDIARATYERFVKEAAAHFVKAMEPYVGHKELPKAADARTEAKKWAEKADRLSDKLSKLAASEFEPSEFNTAGDGEYAGS